MEPWDAVVAQAGLPAVAPERQAAVQWVATQAGTVKARAGSQAALATAPESRGVATAVVARRFEEEPPQAAALVRVASQWVQEPRVEASHNIRRTYFPQEMTCGISDTRPGGQLAELGRVRVARADPWGRARTLGFGAFRSARRWVQTPGSLPRRRRSVCNVRFLVHFRQGS